MLNRLLTLIVMLLLYLTAAGQERTYMIQRGETLQSIAKKFGIHELRIREYNWNVKEFRTGMTIKLPPVAEELSSDEVFDNETDRKLLDETDSLSEKLYHARQELEKLHQNYQKNMQEYHETRMLIDSQRNEIEKMASIIKSYTAKKRASRAEQRRNIGQAFVQALQTTAKQMQAANTSTPNYGGYWNAPNYGTSEEVNKIYDDAWSNQTKQQSIRISAQQFLHQTYYQEMGTYKAPSWADLDKKYEDYVEYSKAHGFTYMDKRAYMNLLTENMAAQTAANQEYINEQKKINEDQRAFNRDMSRREMKSRVDNYKLYNDLKSGSYSGSSYTTTSTSASSSTAATTYTPTSNYDNTPTTPTTPTEQKDNPTHREQYKNKKVYKSDYRDTKDKVTLYRRDGDKHYPDLFQMTVYEQQQRYYILIDNQFYLMKSCSWKDFNYYIHYKHTRYIEYKH